MLEGTVKWFNEDKGFGFISIENQSRDVFVHVKDVKKSGYNKLHKRDIVEFEILEDSLGRMHAANITAYEPL